jgi:hypothetical protein
MRDSRSLLYMVYLKIWCKLYFLKNNLKKIVENKKNYIFRSFWYVDVKNNF